MKMMVKLLEMTIGWVKNKGVVKVWGTGGAAVSVDNLNPINI